MQLFALIAPDGAPGMMINEEHVPAGVFTIGLPEVDELNRAPLPKVAELTKRPEALAVIVRSHEDAEQVNAWAETHGHNCTVRELPQPLTVSLATPIPGYMGQSYRIIFSDGTQAQIWTKYHVIPRLTELDGEEPALSPKQRIAVMRHLKLDL